MRASQADILIVPGHTGSTEDHWQTRWERKLSTARRVAHSKGPDLAPEEWIAAVADGVNSAERPVVLVAHALGVAAVVRAVPLFTRPVAGAFLVAPPDLRATPSGFGPYLRDPLPFPSILVASRDDALSSFETAEDIAAAWGSRLVDAGASGRLDAASGHGPWPEGLLTFGKFLAGLPTPH